MPSIYNGCGTWYYGKKNLHRYEGQCSACKHVTTLTSYDTRLYVVVLLVPIFPLGRKRIIEECKVCRRHRAMPLKLWQEAQRRSEEAISKYRKAPRDSQAATAALQACASYRDLTAFLALAPDVERELALDTKTLCLLAAVYDLFGRLPDAERVLMAAVRVKDEDETREALADCLMRQGRPDEAEPYLQHIIDKGIPDRINSLYVLAQGYQGKGEHEKALALYDRCEAINPLIAQDPVFVQLREASAQQRTSRKAVSPAKIVNKIKRQAAWRKFKKATPVVLVLAALAYGTLAWILGNRRSVYLVNGIDRPYTVRIDGVSHSLGPQSVTKVTLGEGTMKVEIQDSPLPIPAETVTIHTGFLTRPFSNQTFVINPDGAAFLHRVRMFYSASARSGGGRPPESHFFGGQTLQQFGGLDHPFEKFPDSVEADSYSESGHRDGLYLASRDPLLASAMISPTALLMGVADELGEAQVAQIAKRHLLLEPEQSDYLLILQGTTSPQDLTTFLRAGLSKRPVLVQWHRIYQGAIKSPAYEEQIQREYDELLAREPDNTALMYLAGRMSHNLDKRRELYEKSLKGNPPCPFACFSLTFHHLANGRFTEALPLAKKTLELLPAEMGARKYCSEALLAAGDYDGLLELLRADQGKPMPTGYQALVEQVYIHTLSGQNDKAEAAMKSLRQKLDQWNRDATTALLQRVQAQNEYVAGNVAKFVELQEKSTSQADRFAAQLTAGDLKKAEQELPKEAEHDSDNLTSHLLISLAASIQNDTSAAEAHLKSGLDQLTKGDFDDRTFAAALQAADKVENQDYLRLPEEPVKKALILTVIGQRNRTQREACFALARKLNYDRRFPHLLLKRVLDSQPAP